MLLGVLPDSNNYLFIIGYECHSKRILTGLKDLSNVIFTLYESAKHSTQYTPQKDEQNRTSTAYMGSTS